MTRRASVAILGGLLALLLSAPGGGQAHGMILHPRDTDTTALDRPPASVIGQWASNACFVVIGPNHILTTRHQNSMPSRVWIAGEPYDVAAPPEWTGGQTTVADIQVARIRRIDGTPANLTEFTPIWTVGSETGKHVVIGGFGKVRGNALGDPPYGYQWDNGTRALLWGVNKIDREELMSGDYLSSVLRIDFDAPDRGGYQPYEAVPADWDSGGGWFFNDRGAWRLIAISAYTERKNATFFNNPATPMYDPDWAAGIRVGAYAAWINAILGYKAVCGDADRDGDVDFTDYTLVKDAFGTLANARWEGGDFDDDQDVDFLDYIAAKSAFGYRFIAKPMVTPDPAPGIVSLPEPTSLALLLLGAAALLRRRRPAA